MYLKMASPPDDGKDRSPKYKLVFDIFFPVVGFFVLLHLNCPSFSYPALTTLVFSELNYIDAQTRPRWAPDTLSMRELFAATDSESTRVLAGGVFSGGFGFS